VCFAARDLRGLVITSTAKLHGGLEPKIHEQAGIAQSKYVQERTDQITDQSVPTCIKLPSGALNKISVLDDV
jgi:hypothetical protein